MVALNPARLLLVLMAVCFWSVASVAVKAEDLCHDPEEGPERYLADIEQLPIVPIDPPPDRGFPDPALPGSWLFEVIFSLLLVIVAVGAKVQLFRRRGRVALRPIEKLAVAVMLLGVLSLGLLVTATDTMLRGRWISTYLQAAGSYWQQGEHGQAEARLAEAQGLQTNSLMRKVTPFYESALERLDIEGMRTVNGISAVRTAIGRRDPEAVERALTYFEPDSEEAVEASIAALSYRSRWLLGDGETAGAVDSARRAHDFHRAGMRTRSNLCAARYHHAVALARAGDAADAYGHLKLLEPPDCALEAIQRTAVRGLVARSFATEYLDLKDPTPANTAGAVHVYEEAYQYGQQHEQDLPFLACDLVAALDAHAIVTLARDQPAVAVEALDQADGIIPGQPFVAAFLPPALYALGNKHLATENFEPAIEEMERGYRLTEGRDPMLIEGLSRSYFALGASQVEADERDRAIDSFEKAHEVDPSNQSIRRALADSLLVRGDERLKIGDLTGAKPDFQRAADVSRERRATARLRLRVMEQTPQRLHALAQKPNWLGVPELYAEVPRDEDADGVLEVLLYYGASPTKPIAVGELSSLHLEPKTLYLLDDRGAIKAMLRDHDKDGRLDERSTYSGKSIRNLIIDIDSDGSPDVEIHYRNGVEFSRQPLSGKIRMVMHEGVIGEMFMDIFSQADAYVKLFHNGELQFISDTAEDSNFPIWNQGVALYYRDQDYIRLELWDEDIVTLSDLIDVYETASLPRSGVYAFRNDKAAVRVSVNPSDLPVGLEIRIDTPEVVENYFRDHPAAVSEYGDLVARARADAIRAEVMQFIARRVVHSAVYSDVDTISPNSAQGMVIRLIADILMNETM